MRTVLSSADPKLSTGTPYWPVRNKPRPSYPALVDDCRCDVVVIGGGITGSLLAYRLAYAGLDTALVDKGRVGSGSTSASTALVSYEYDELLSDLAKRMGERDAVRAYRLSYEASGQLKGLVQELEDPCDHQPKFAVRVSNNEGDFQHLIAEARLRTRHGMAVDVLDGNALEARFGVSAGLGLVSDHASQIDPFKLARRLVARAMKVGLRAFENTKVTQFSSAPHGCRLECANGARIDAKRVVFATGYESERYLGKTGAKLNTDFCLVSHPLKKAPRIERCHLVENADEYLYLSTFGNRVMVGMEGKSLYGPAERSRLMRRRTRELLERAGTYLPTMRISVDYRWASTFASMPDSLPVLGETSRFFGALFALGYGGNGIASSAMLAPMVVELLVKGRCPDAEIFRLGR